MVHPTRISYSFVVLLFILVGWLHLATPLLAMLFSYFALDKLTMRGNRWIAIGLYLLLLAGVAVGFSLFAREAYQAVPKIASTTIPVVLEYAEKQGIQLPFTDYASAKKVALQQVSDELAGLGRYAKVTVLEIAGLIIGIVAAISLFLNSRIDLEPMGRGTENNVYSRVTAEIARRFTMLYESFATVMGAQILISAINTALTAGFLFWTGFPFAMVIVVATFLCGLLPIVGNLISNTLIVGVALTISPTMALGALVFLVVLHKLEYFLNSKIIGDRIRNPMWLTLLGLIVGEKLMGIPGMILAPVVLHYIKVEAKRHEIAPAAQLSGVAPAEVA